MFGAFQTFGKLGAIGKAVAAAWTPSALWPTGTEAGMWIDPSNLASQWQDSAGTTPVATPGTVADSSNPVGLALDLRLGATALTDPGNHLLQATSTARPLLSARRNWLTYTEDFTHAPWTANSYGSGTITLTQNYALAPDGSMTACRLQATAPTASADGGLLRYGTINAAVIRSYWAKSNTGSNQKIIVRPGFATATVTSEWQQITYYANELVQMFDSGLYRDGGAFDSDATCDILIWHPQLEFGTTATDYQSVPTDGSTYAPATPVAQLYDGTDDGMATATFAAGTLTSAMDCMIAVRRDAATQAVCGLYTSPVRAKYFGHAQDSSAAVCFSESGSPTVWVDGIQLTGGTSVTADTLHTALTVGNWHILEFRGLDMSAWTSLNFGEFGSGFSLDGAQGGILLFPGGNTAERDKARAWLAAKVGVTLP